MAYNNTTNNSKPRILIVTPEITYLPSGMGNMANNLKAKAGGLADVSASLVSALFDLGADVHVALPHYRRMFHIDIGKFINDELRVYKSILPDSRIHLAQDRIFYYRDDVYSNYYAESHKVALAFQREIINNIIPKVQPSLIHCNDWMTGLIPATARRMNIPCLLTLHNIHTQETTLERIEDIGIDAAEFWPYLYYLRPPLNYEETRSSNPVDFLASGIFASHFINTVSPTFLDEIAEGKHDFIPPQIRSEVVNKKNSNCAFGILNAPDPSFNPATDTMIEVNYTHENHSSAKKQNKLAFQKMMGLKKDPDAPLFFWPSRLDPAQKGCQLLAEIMYKIISDYWDKNLQIAVVANGPFYPYFRHIADFHNIQDRLAVINFDEKMARMGYAASDFMLIPSLFEPCGLPQMISCIYGSLPIAHDTGGLHDTVSDINVKKNSGNGFLFKIHDAAGLNWAIDQAMLFYDLPKAIKNAQISRVMTQSAKVFNHSVTASNYFSVYEQMLKRPLINPF